MDIIKADCSGCAEPFTLDRDSGAVTMRVPSNGRRGALHVPARDVTTEAVSDGTLLLWECPRCGYAESEYEREEDRP